MRHISLHHRWLLVIGLLLTVVVWADNAWVCDDAYINFRSLDQLQAGNGPIWNPHERVQVYTSVFWFWLQAPLRVVSADVFANVLVLSLIGTLGCVLALRRFVSDDRAWLVLLILITGARGFMDFTSSGLENPLVFLVCALLLDRFLATILAAPGSPEASRPLRHLLWLAGWSLLVRHDLALLWLPPVVQAMWRHRRVWTPRQWASTLIGGAAPLLLWSAFAVFYYGSPWPNPALAKLALRVPREILLVQGLHYFQVTLRDPVLALVIIAGTVVALVRRDLRGLGIGILCHLAYLLWIGGDFMLGRMLGGVFVVAGAVLTRILAMAGPRWVWTAGGVAALLAVFLPLTPLNSPRDLHDETFVHGIADERAYYFTSASLWVRLRTPADDFPVHEWAEDGRIAARRDQVVVGAKNVGFFGYLAGGEKIVVDLLALTDPFLARLAPATLADDWRPGHIKRGAPRGYGASLQSGENRLQNATQRRLYDDVRLATSGPLWQAGRASAIWRLNTRRYGR